MTRGPGARGLRAAALWWLLLAGLACGSAKAQSLPSTGTRAVPTYESAGLYWANPGGTAGCQVRYRKAGAGTWSQGLDLWYDERDAECRGSLVGLEPNSDYQVELNLPGQAASRALSFHTWSNKRPVARTVAVGGGSATLDITEGGTAAGYVVYDGNGATLDAQNAAQFNVTINASYVIVRGLVLRGAQRDAVRISPTVKDVVIEDNDISGWGRQRSGSWGVDMDSAIRAVCTLPTLERVTIQRNRIHDPRYSANSWSDGHPAGPQAITFSYCGGNHVIRHNEMYSTTGRYFNDVIGGEDNFSQGGFPNSDTDIYGNLVSHAWDDGIEAEGANENVRIWGNYIDRTAIGIATTVTSIGPAYIFRNVWNRSQFYERTVPDADDRQPFFKSGSDTTLGSGRRYVFHNTMLQAMQAGTTYGLGGGFGMGGTGSSQLITNTVSKNNIYHLWKPGKSAFYQTGAGNEIVSDLYSGTPGDATIVNGINCQPTYLPGHGWVSEAGGNYQLAAGTPGYDDGARIANFNDGFIGAGPDVGAHESGSASMKFGLAASPGSAVLSGTSPAAVMSPAPGSVLGGDTQLFRWNDAGASLYQLWLGSTPGGYDLGYSTASTALSATMSGLPIDGRTIYARLYSSIGGAYYYTDATFTAATALGAVVGSPANGSALAGSSQLFQWNDVGAGLYQLWLGSAPGGYDLGYSPASTALSATMSGLPADGRVIYARLYSSIGGAYHYTDSTYLAATGSPGAVVSCPPSGCTLGGSAHLFQWNNVGAGFYQLWLGSTPGGYDLGYSPASTALSANMTGLPTDGRTIYARLYSSIGGVYYYTDTSYTAASGVAGAAITSPAPGSTLSGASQLFQWNDAGAAFYQLWAGTTPGGYDLGYSPASSALSATLTGLPTNGSTLFVRLYSNIAGAYHYRDFAYTTGP